jgi:hypothetical protein
MGKISGNSGRLRRGARLWLRLFTLIIAATVLTAVLSGCSGPNYHTLKQNGETYYIMDKEYEGDYDLQKVRFVADSSGDAGAWDNENLFFLNGQPLPQDFRQETVMDRAAYEAYCVRYGLTAAFPDHDGSYAVLACMAEQLCAVEVQVADAAVEGDSLRLLYRDRFHNPYPDSMGFVLTVPVPAAVTKLKALTVYTLKEERNLREYGTPNDPNETNAPEKPVIYLYPEVETEVRVRLDYDGELTCTYPAYHDGWTVTAEPDGTLSDKSGTTYSYLYWEGVGSTAWDLSKGFCVRGEDTASFLEDALTKLGLTRREANEFIVYWLPRMEDNAWNLISFQGAAYTDSARLTVSPAPDTTIRVFMVWEGLDAPVEIEPQVLTAPERNGFVLVEWGGSEG